MKRQFPVIVLMCICIFPAISLADMWIERDWDYYNRITIMADDLDWPPVDYYDIYVGLFYDASVSALPHAGHGASVAESDFDRYPSVYHLQSGLAPIEGEQFEIIEWGMAYSIALYDSNRQIIGSYTEMIDPCFSVYIPDTYTICPGQSVDLIGYSYKIPLYPGWTAGTDFSEQSTGFWTINGASVPKHVSYEYLTEQMGLTPGTYEVVLYDSWEYCWISDDEAYILDDWATTTITIVPEPTSLLLFAAGAVFFKGKINKHR